MLLRLVSIVAAVLVATGGIMVVVFGPEADPATDGELRSGISATTINSFTVSPSTAYVGEPVTFTASASSTTGSQLTFTFFYDATDNPYPTNNTESPYTTHTTGNPGTVTTEFTYDRLGNLTFGTTSGYVVRLFVGDGSDTVSLSKTVYVIDNTAPRFEVPLPTTLTLDPDQVAYINITVEDADDDPVTVTWDFGDGAVVVNETGNAELGIDVRQSHAWSPELGPGMGPVLYYYMVVTLEDPYSHTTSRTVEVGIRLPYNGLPTVYFDASTNNVDPEVEDEVTFYTSAKDPEGEALTWTFLVNSSFEDVEETVATFVSHTDVTPANTTVWNNLTYEFTVPGDYSVRVYVSDALIPYQVSPHNVTKVESVYVVGNAVPGVTDEIAVVGIPTINTTIGFVILTFTVTVYDSDGDALTGTWDMDEGIIRTNTTDGDRQQHVFAQDRLFNKTGSYNISVTVTDGVDGHDVTRYKLLNVSSNNLPPVAALSFSYELGDYAYAGETIEFTLTLSDPEMDALEVVWDFHDNTSLIQFNLTEYVNGSLTCVVNHTFNALGTYNLTIYYTDNQVGLLNHTKEKKATVVVNYLPLKVVEPWDWWDYTSLGLLALIVIVFILNQVRVSMNRRRLEEKGGMSWEEMKLREDEMSTDEETDFYTEVD